MKEEGIIKKEYKNIKEVDINGFNNSLININHSICETKKDLLVLKE